MAPRPLIIDTDPGKDDAVAILLALAAPDLFRLPMISAAAGNLGLERTTANALRLCEAVGRHDIPVYPGCPRPMLQTLETVPHIHGEDGLGGATLPPPSGAPAKGHAVTALIDCIERSAEPVTLACIAPLTNLGVALAMAPHIAGNIAEIAVMGGSFTTGNITPYASFNIYSDPHAARIVFGCGAPVTMVGLEVTRRTMPTAGWCARLRESGSPAATVVADLWHDPTAFMNDACVIAYLMDPALIPTEAVRVEIDTDATETIGRTRKVDGPPNLRAACGIDVAGFFDLLMDRLSRPPAGAA